MNNLTGAEHVITVFSKAYFKSKWCMFELLRAFQKGNFSQRTYPIIADDCDLQDTDYRLSLVTYWKAQYDEAKARLDKHETGVILDEHRHVNLYQYFYKKINELLNFAASRMTTELDKLRA